jgi:hypothetical protein
MDKIKDMIDELARGYVAALDRETVCVYSTSHVYLNHCHGCLPPEYRPVFDARVTELLKGEK